MDQRNTPTLRRPWLLRCSTSWMTLEVHLNPETRCVDKVHERNVKCTQLRPTGPTTTKSTYERRESQFLPQMTKSPSYSANGPRDTEDAEKDRPLQGSPSSRRKSRHGYDNKK